MLTDLQKVLANGVLLNSALYLIMCFVAGILTGNPMAWKLAVASVGLCYVSYMGQYFSGLDELYARIGQTAVACSIVSGVCSGIALLWKS